LAYVTLHVRELDYTVDAIARAGFSVLQRISKIDADVTLPAPIGRVRARYAFVADGNRVELMEQD
jgi:hypothetical protein